MRARYYDPAAGRFISEDPILSGINWYAYCNNNPINATDPTGKMVEDPLEASAIGGTIEGGGGFAAMVKTYIENKVYDLMSKYVAATLVSSGAAASEGVLESEGYMSWIVQTRAFGPLKVAIDWSMHAGCEYIHWNFTKSNGQPAGGSPNHLPLEAAAEVLKWLNRML